MTITEAFRYGLSLWLMSFAMRIMPMGDPKADLCGEHCRWGVRWAHLFRGNVIK